MSTGVEETAVINGNPAFLSDLEHGTDDIDLSTFMLDAQRASGVDVDIASVVIDGEVERAIDGASTLKVTVFDGDLKLLNSKLWDYTIEVELDDHWWRLVQVGWDYPNLTLTFEDRVVSWMRDHTKPLKVSRSKMTRAEFVHYMVSEIKADNLTGHPLHFFAPELHVKQPLTKAQSAAARRSTRSGGLSQDLVNSGDITIQGARATRDQLKVAEQVLDQGSAMSANQKVMVSAIMTAIQESRLLNSATNGVHVGVFQQESTPGSIWVQRGGASRNATRDARAYFIGAIASDKSNPGQQLADLSESVQVSGQGSLYAKWTKEAEKIVAEYGGGIGSPTLGDQQEQFYKQFQFTRGQPGGPKGESTWDAALRLAKEVERRFFVVGVTVYYITDTVLIQSKPIMTIDEMTDGIDSITFDFDVGKKTNEVTIECRASRWFANPGEVVVLLPTMGPVAGRWLVERCRRPLFKTNATITLKQVIKPLAEPRPQLASRSVPGTINTGGNLSGGAWTAPSGGAKTFQGPDAQLLNFLAGVAQNTYGLTITATTNGNHVADSYHFKGEAFDAAGSEARMRAFAQFVLDHYLTHLTELIHNPGFAVKHGSKVDGPSFYSEVWAGHQDHVHVAMAESTGLRPINGALLDPIAP